MIEGVVSCAMQILGAPSENIPMTDRLCAAMCVQWVTILVMSVQYAYACLIMDGYKTGESRNTMHVANCKGLFIVRMRILLLQVDCHCGQPVADLFWDPYTVSPDEQGS